MSKDPIANFAEHQTWTAPYEKPMQDAVKDVFHSMGDAGHTVRNALHGTWLHEPLHAILVQVPVGSWTAAAAFDAVAALGGSEGFDVAADAAIGFGLLGAIGAAVTGMNDWADVQGAPKRIGAVHAALNALTVGLYSASWVLRRRHSSRSAARWLGMVGFLGVSVSSHLGHNMVYEHGVGVQDTQPLE